MLFQKNDLIELENGRQYEAICVDESIAVFAPIKIRKKDNAVSTSYKGMFAYGNWDNAFVTPGAWKRIERSDLK